MMPSLFTLAGVLLGTAVGAGMEMAGYEPSRSLAAMVAAEVLYVVVWLTAEARFKRQRPST